MWEIWEVVVVQERDLRFFWSDSKLAVCGGYRRNRTQLLHLFLFFVVVWFGNSEDFKRVGQECKEGRCSS